MLRTITLVEQINLDIDVYSYILSYLRCRLILEALSSYSKRASKSKKAIDIKYSLRLNCLRLFLI